MSFYRFLRLQSNLKLPLSNSGREVLGLLATERAQRVLAAVRAQASEGVEVAQLCELTGIRASDLSLLLRRLAHVGLIHSARSAPTGSPGRPPLRWYPAEAGAWRIFELAERAAGRETQPPA